MTALKNFVHAWDSVANEEKEQFWNHPAASPLALVTRVSTGMIDIDSDSYIPSMMLHVWVEDILQRRTDSDISPNLLQYARIIRKTTDAITDSRERYRRAFKAKQEQIEQEEREAVDSEEDTIFAKLRGKSETARALVDQHIEESDALEEIVNTTMQDFLIEVVRTDYQPTRSTVYKYLHQGVQDMPDRKDFDQFFTHGMQYDTSFSKNFYTMYLASFPGRYLPHYVHDVCLYHNFVQWITVYGREHEQEIVISGNLLSRDRTTVLEAFQKVIPGIHGWWT